MSQFCLDLNRIDNIFLGVTMWIPQYCKELFIMENQFIYPAVVTLQMVLNDVKLLHCCSMLYTTKWATNFYYMFDY